MKQIAWWSMVLMMGALVVTSLSRVNDLMATFPGHGHLNWFAVVPVASGYMAVFGYAAHRWLLSAGKLQLAAASVKGHSKPQSYAPMIQRASE
jgi:hypothetical protein